MVNPWRRSCRHGQEADIQMTWYKYIVLCGQEKAVRERERVREKEKERIKNKER